MAENALINVLNFLRKFLWNCLFIISYPIITSFSLAFMGIIWIFSSLSRLLSRVSTKKDFTFELKKPTWEDVATIGKYQLEKLFVDDILFGPTYYKFRSRPASPVFEDVFFGDFVYPCFDGILLQKWNSTTYKDLPDFTLVYFNGVSGEISDLQVIRSFSWIAQKISDDEVLVKWFNGTEGGEVVVNKYKLNNISTVKFGS
jgi:hypothetical protein